MDGKADARSVTFVYFAFVLGWSACFWLLSAAVSPGLPPERSPIFLTGGAGPFIGAVVFTYLGENRAKWQDFWRRALDPRLLSFGWFSISLILHPALVLISLAIDRALGAAPSAVSFPQSGLAGFFGLVFFTFWFGPLPEEIGWRGYALDRLQSRHSALRASIILGLAWAGWHLPLFAVPGTFQHSLGFNSYRFWIFMAGMTPLSIIMTWVYNSSGRSTLSAALVHFSGNLCGALIPKTDRLAGIEFLLLTICAIALVFSFGTGRLIYPRSPDPAVMPSSRESARSRSPRGCR